MTNNIIRVLLIEDDPMVQEVNREFVERLADFQVVGTATNGVEGLEKIRVLHPDLVILDVFMPQQDGITTLQLIRQENLNVDVIVITAANDARTIQSMLQNGAIDYIMKPFKFERVKQALDNYRILKIRIDHQKNFSQTELDQLMFGNTNDRSTGAVLPKGLQEITLKQIIMYLMNQVESRSAEEVAEGVGLARVTARRYLDYLEKIGKVIIDLQYGGVGRPINRYMTVKKYNRNNPLV